MTTTLLTSAVAMLFGLAVLRRFTGGGRGAGAITAADLGVVLATAEIVLLVDTLITIGVVVGPAPAALVPTLAVVGIGLVVAGSFLRAIGTIVAALGVVAAITDAWLQDGATIGAMLLMLVALLWMINRLVRLLLPWPAR